MKENVYDGLESWGEAPANIDTVPGAIKIDDVAHLHNLDSESKKHLLKNPEILEGAQRFGKDLVAYTSSHGKEIIIGIGVAAAVTVGGVVLYKHLPGAKKK